MLLNPSKCYNTKMSYKTMQRKISAYKIQKLTPARPEERMLGFLPLFKIIVMKLKNYDLDLYNSFDFSKVGKTIEIIFQVMYTKYHFSTVPPKILKLPI